MTVHQLNYRYNRRINDASNSQSQTETIDVINESNNNTKYITSNNSNDRDSTINKNSYGCYLVKMSNKLKSKSLSKYKHNHH